MSDELDCFACGGPISECDCGGEGSEKNELIIRVVPQTVPTTAAPFHYTATHVDALGMPVAFSSDPEWPYHPTPCCGAAASISDGPMYCKRCYEPVDYAFGNFPVEPYRPIQEVS